MTRLRNPFAVRNGEVILIEDLTQNERGAKCNCKCPSCEADFVARMGEIKEHHFAHSKDSPCNATLAYTSGLYKIIHQALSRGNPFYVPALVVAYSFPRHCALNRQNIESHTRIVSEKYAGENKVIVSGGKLISFENACIVFDSKNNMQAIELTYASKKIAIKVVPPDTICKQGTVSPHNGMATLALDFTDDTDVIQNSNSKAFKEYFLSDSLKKDWIYNPKASKANQKIFTIYREYCEQKKQHDAMRKLAERQNSGKQKNEAQQHAKEQRSAEHERVAEQETQGAMLEKKRIAEIAAAKAKREDIYALGYNEVKDRFGRQTEPILDSFGVRWIQCELCGAIKQDEEFWTRQYNNGKCKRCLMQKNE